MGFYLLPDILFFFLNALGFSFFILSFSLFAVGLFFSGT